jgi:hypothetical protein
MATSTDVNICNMALTLLGAATITSLSDQNKEARRCSQELDNVRRQVLRSHPWRCAKKRATLSPTSFTISSISWAADVISVATTAAHGLLAGDRIDIDDCSITEYNEDDLPILTVPTPTTFTATLDLDADPGADSDGTVQEVPVFDYEYMMRLPSDWVRFYILDDTTIAFAVEGRKILTDESSLNIVYVYDVSDWDLMDESLKRAIAAKLAATLCVSLVGEKRVRAMHDEYTEAIRDARFNNAIESPPVTRTVDTWTNARR